MEKYLHYALYAVLALVAWKIVKHFTAAKAPQHADGAPYVPGQYRL